ncbi:FAD binding domain-containing protein [Jatrophihabitans sp. DSM 45814]
MRAFEYLPVRDVDDAIATMTALPGAAYLAGGTTQLDLMKDGVLAPDQLVDISRLPLRGVVLRTQSIQVGALTTMEEFATDPIVTARFPILREALLLGASTQLRNMATIGGNLLQRTRCRYFRDPAVAACNKRMPGSGCAAVTGAARMHAIVGVSDRCIALHASDVAVALVALDAVVHLQGPASARRVALTEFYVEAAEDPEIENVLGHGELITGIEIPLLPQGTRSGYLKVRDRVSYEFALASAGVALHSAEGLIREARVGLGGVGSKPWRAREAERVLIGAPATGETFERAARAELTDAWTVPGTEFKVELGRRTLQRALQVVSGVAP